MLSIWLRFFRPLALPLLILLPSFLWAGNISGAVTSDTTWNVAGSPVIIMDSVTVVNGKTLTIEPGVVVKFHSGTTLVVDGTLIAVGTSGNRITFTSNLGSPVPGDWRNLTFLSSASVNSVLNYCLFEYGGSGTNGASILYATGAAAIRIANTTVRFSAGHGVNVRSSSPRISTSIFRDNAGYGVYSDLVTNMIVDSSVSAKNTQGGIRIPINSSPTITNTRIDSNGVGIFIDNSSFPTIQKNNIRYNNIGIQFTAVGTTQPTISQDTIKGNTTWGFLNMSTSTTVLARNNYWGSDLGPFHPSLNPTGLGDNVSNNVDFQPWTIIGSPLAVTQWTTNITKDTTWESGVFWVKNSISVSSGVTLTIKPDVIVKFASGVRLTVSGTLVADGTLDSLIVFTSERDDPYGGDTNGDGGATIPARGNWDMVFLYAGGNNSSVLNFCLFRFGGSSGNGNVRVDQRTPAIFNSSFTQSSNYGLFLYNGANDSLANCTFGSNSLDGVLIQSASPKFYKITAVNNGRYGILATSGSIQFSVRKSLFIGNSYGIVADAGSASATLVSLDSSNISNNINGGLYLWYGTGPQYFGYNRIANNGAYGLWCFNVNNLVTIEGDTIVNNGQDGITTSKALVNNNIIQNNRYPITLIGRLGTTYSSNTISGNTYNNAIALRLNRYEESFADTLKSTFPAEITSNTYVTIENASGWGVNSGSTLVIHPGVIIKMDPGMYWRVEGTLLADASSGSPIVFTSYRDASYGGKTNLASDNSLPAPNDWRYIRIRTSSANASLLNNVMFKYGGQDNVGNLWLEATITLANPIRNIISRKSSNMGIRVGDGVLTFENVTVDSNGSYGMYVEGNRPSNVAIRNSVIQDNASQGLRAVNNSAFSEVSNCIIRRNSSWGIGVDNGTIPQTYSGNTVTYNGAGIYNNSPNVAADNLLFIGNTISDNGSGDGILSSRARFIDNRIERNRFPFAVWRRTGNIYKDNNGADGNIISGNTYNNAIAIWDGAISDTLNAQFPQAITSKTYVAIYNFQVDAGTTLVIEPGVNIKFQEIPANNWRTFNVYGTLIAEGTPSNPIIFTSWRDSTVGGKTAAVNDYTAPAPGDWNSVWFHNGSGASIVRYCQFKYAGRYPEAAIRFEDNVSGIVFSNNLIHKSSQAGMFIVYSALTIDSTTVDSCASYGIRLYQDNRASLVLRQSKILSNGSYGVWAQSPSKISIISNSDISRNAATGVYVENNSVPLTVIGNSVANNGGHGLYLVARNDGQDTLLLIAGNKIRNNTVVGLFSSRAYVVDDSITGNRYAIGVTRQASLANKGTANGNVYQNNYIAGNTYEGTMVTEETVYGRIGFSYPPGYTSNVIAVRGGLYVPSAETLTVAPGTTFKFPKEYTGGAGGTGRFRCDGALRVEGTTNNKIIYTSWKDDSFGGDTNGDGNGSVPAAGDWDMIWLYGSNNNNSKIFQTIVRYGGSVGNGNIRWDNNSAPMDSSFSSFSSNYGLFMYTGATPLITASEIHNNPTGVLLQSSANPVFHRNNIRDNSNYGMLNQTSNTIDATNNYWGHSSGPYVNETVNPNLAGLGNRIDYSPGVVNYIPFLTSRSGILLGDVSENGTISAYDGALVLQYAVSLISLAPSQLAAAEVSGDGTVSAFDASFILRYVVGLITGFPGAGKVERDANIFAAFDFRTERPNGDEIHLIFNLKKTVPIFATELKLGYDSTLVRAVSVQKAPLTQDMSMEFKLEADTTRVALAGTQSVNEEGDALRIVFKLSDQARGKPTIPIAVARLILNETNVTPDSKQVVVNSETPQALPTFFALGQNYPNPFNPVTSIEYQLPVSSSVALTIYDVLGQEIRTLVNDEQKAGYYKVAWDGKNASGEAVSTGMYLYRIQATGSDQKNFVEVKRMVLLK